MRDLAGVAVFVTVVEKRSFNAAAVQLNQSPSTVSKQIVRLEHELGTKLINRSTHHLILTESGRVFLTRARQLLADVDLMLREVRSVRDDFLGTLRIHLTPGAGKHIALPAIYEFIKLHRSLKLDLTVSPEAVDILSDGYDLAIRSGGDIDSYLKHTSIKSLRLARAHYQIGASAAYFREAGRPTHPQELTNHRCIVYRSQPGPNQWWFRDGSKRYSVIVDGAVVANDWATVHDAAREGLGIARLLYSEFDQNTDRQIEFIFTNLLDSDRGIWAFYPHMKPLPRKTQALLRFLSKQLPSKTTLER